MLITAQSYIVYCPTQLTCLEDFDFHIYHLCTTNLYKHQSEIYEKQYCSQIDMSIPAPLLQSLLLQDIYLKLIDMLFVRKSYSLQPHKTVVLCTFLYYTPCTKKKMDKLLNVMQFDYLTDAAVLGFFIIIVIIIIVVVMGGQTTCKDGLQISCKGL